MPPQALSDSHQSVSPVVPRSGPHDASEHPLNAIDARIAALRQLRPILGDDWVDKLESRKQEEAAFHDNDREGHRDEIDRATANRRFYAAAQPVAEHLDRWLEARSRGAVFLDFACGNGVTAVRAASLGALLAVGIDISAVSVENAAENAAKAGVADTALFLQRDCEDTGLPDQCFDAVLCSGMLHHLDLARAFPELHRILRPGGRILCVEALAYNPAIQLYRELTPGLRTEWEKRHILGMKEVRFARRWFDVENLRFHLMAAPLATFLPEGFARNFGLRVGHAIDAVLTRIPLLRLWSWQFTFELVRREESDAKH